MELLLLQTLDSQNRVVSALRFYPPRPMRGKTGWHIFASSLETPSLAHEQVKNIRFFVYIQDRLHSAGSTNKLQAWDILADEKQDEQDGVPLDDEDDGFQWINWSDTRWGVMPWSARYFLRSRIVGID